MPNEQVGHAAEKCGVSSGKNLSPPSAHPSSRFYSSTIGAMAGLAVLFLAALSWHIWQETEQTQIEYLSTVAESASRTTDSYFDQLAKGLGGLAEDIAQTGTNINLDRAYGLVKRFVDLHPELINVTLIRADGQILLSAKDPPSPTLPSLATPSFKRFLDELPQIDSVQIGQVTISALTHQPNVPFRFAVKAADGGLVFVVSANLPADHLKHPWEDTPFARIASFGLIRDDGFLLSRYPVPDRVEMQELYGTPRTGDFVEYLRANGFPTSGHMIGVSSTDGKEYLFVFQRLSHYPVSFFAAVPRVVLQANWWRAIQFPILLTGILLVGGVFALRSQERNNRKLAASEERYRALFTHIQTGFTLREIILDDAGQPVDCRFLAVNDAFLATRGLRADEVIGKTLTEVHPDVVNDPTDWIGIFGEVALTGKPIHFEAFGTVDKRWYEVTAYRTESLQVATLFSNITERKQAENALAESSYMLRTIIDTAPIRVFWKDRTLRYLGCNPAFARDAGKKHPDEVVGEDDYNLAWAEQADLYRADDRDVMDSGIPRLSFEEPQTTPDGRTIWLSTSKIPLKDRDNETIGILGVYEDITERKATEALREARVLLQKELAERKEAERISLRIQRVALMALADLAEHRDTDTGDHVLRVARMTHEIARTLLNKGVEPEVCDENFLRHVGWASILHDVGKVTIPDNILFKPGKLSIEERQIMETHAFGGSAILNKATRMLPDSAGFKLARDVSQYHHENWDGSGYPAGLKGRDIPLSARIVSVADVFDALTSSRPYKKPWTQEAAKEFVRENCGKKFDPVVVEALFDVLEIREQAEIVEWNNDIAIGHPVIDRDHRILLGLINQIAVKQNADDPLAVRFVLDGLVSYTFDHFEREEILMKESGYPDIERHKGIHEAMFSEIQRFISNLDESKCDISTDLASFLKGWLTTHIMQTDREYIPFVVRGGNQSFQKPTQQVLTVPKEQFNPDRQANFIT
ncbi:MAG: bacteriohemerythrin [Rhodospirillaceae bacterium]